MKFECSLLEIDCCKNHRFNIKVKKTDSEHSDVEMMDILGSDQKKGRHELHEKVSPPNSSCVNKSGLSQDMQHLEISGKQTHRILNNSERMTRMISVKGLVTDTLSTTYDGGDVLDESMDRIGIDADREDFNDQKAALRQTTIGSANCPDASVININMQQDIMRSHLKQKLGDENKPSGLTQLGPMKFNPDIGNSMKVEFKGPDALDTTMRSPEIDGGKYGKYAQEPSFLVERTNVAGSNPDQIIVNKLPEQETNYIIRRQAELEGSFPNHSKKSGG